MSLNFLFYRPNWGAILRINSDNNALLEHFFDKNREILGLLNLPVGQSDGYHQ